MKELILAKSAGFCFGVSRSVDMAEKLLAEKGCGCSLGQLIHNEDVVKELEEKGLRVIHSPEEAGAGDNVLIRAHGVSRELVRRLEERGAIVTDATCPKVKHIHSIVSQADEEGRFVMIIGMRRHPEVEASCTKGATARYFTTENARKFKENARIFLPEDINVEHIDLE